MKLLPIFVVTLAVTACSSATTPMKPAGRAEFLKMEPYPANPAWKKITDKANPTGSIREWIPADQDENAIRDILTEQTFYTLRGKDPQDFLNGMVANTQKICGGMRHSGKSYVTETPPYAYTQIFCIFPGGSHEEVDMFIKAIAGKDALYVVQREFHYPKAEGVAGVNSFGRDQAADMVAMLKEIGLTNKYLENQVFLCPSDGSGPSGCTDGSPNWAEASLSPR